MFPFLPPEAPYRAAPPQNEERPFGPILSPAKFALRTNRTFFAAQNSTAALKLTAPTSKFRPFRNKRLFVGPQYKVAVFILTVLWSLHATCKAASPESKRQKTHPFQTVCLAHQTNVLR